MKVVRVKVCDVVGRFGRVISLDQRVVCPCVPFAHRRDSAPHPPLDEQVHVQVRQQLQLDTCLLQERVPAQAWRAVVVRRVQPVFFLAHLPEVLEHVCQQQNVCCHVQVVVVAHRPAAECRPDFLRMRVLCVCDAFSAQTRVELSFLRELSFIKPFKRVHVLIRVDAFLQQQPPLVVFREYSLYYRKTSHPFTSLSRLLCMKFTLSMNLRFPSEKEMYFSVFVGMHLISPCALAIPCISRCPSEIGAVFAFSFSLKLHSLRAAPRYFLVMWSWSFTESLKFFTSRGSTQNRHVFWVFAIHSSISSFGFLLSRGTYLYFDA